jgi:hypothetical protein
VPNTMQVTIGANTYFAYADLATAVEYLAANIEAGPFLAASPDVQAQCLVSMTRTLDRQLWQGDVTVPGQAHAFPRINLQYADGTPVDSATVPQQVIDACCEGAAQLADGSNLMDVQNTFNYDKRLKAGSVEIEKFRQTDDAPRFPQVIMELVGLWLGGGAGVPVGSRSTGTGGCTAFDRLYDFTQGF